MFALWPAN